MALDPVLKGFLDQMAMMPGPKMFELPPAQGREMFVAMMQMIGPKDVPVGKVETINIPGPGGEMPLRVYTPVAAGADALPVLIYFHGGGFVIGDLETHDGLCRQFANEGGFRVIAVDYRRAPEHKFPAALDDAFAAVQWIEKHASELGVDANCIAVGGDSAGGALAAEVSQLAKAKGAPKIAFQLLMFPVTQIGMRLGRCANSRSAISSTGRRSTGSLPTTFPMARIRTTRECRRCVPPTSRGCRRPM